MTHAYSDPAMTGSRFPRQNKDRYWTAPWVTKALHETVPPLGPIWEPAAGRGDMVQALYQLNYTVFAGDIDSSEYEVKGPCTETNFLTGDLRVFLSATQPASIVTNPPYDSAVYFVRRGIEILQDDNSVRYMAMLLRSEFKHAKGRANLFGNCPLYAGEVVLTSRPRWDWWFRDRPIASPRHNYSWFLWTQALTKPRQWFHYKGAA